MDLDFETDEPECVDCGSTDLELVVVVGERTRYICSECGEDFWLPEEEGDGQ